MVASLMWAINYSNDNEGLIQYSQTNYTYQVPKRTYVIGQFARFIRPGATLITSTSTSSTLRVVGTRSSAGAITVVLMNTSKQSNTSTVSLVGLGTPPTSLSVYRTSSTENQAQLSPVAVNNGSFTITVPSQSVVTLTQ